MNKQSHTVFISGWGAGSAPMAMLADQLHLEAFTTLSLKDLRERGQCPDNRNHDSELSAYSAGLEDVLDSLDAPATVVGWSTGGIAALETLGRVPEKVKCLVLLSTAAKFCADTSFPHGTPEANLLTMVEGIQTAPKQTLKNFVRQAAIPQRLTEDQVRERVAEAMAQGEETLLHGLEYLRTSDVRANLCRIDCPVLIMHGRKDRVISWRAAEWLSSQLPNNELQIHPRGGHLLLVQNSNDVNPQIQAFFNQYS